ncbi:hypothetical protein EV201_0077 [Ancylomarina subtilis]|uniref:Uncharacterized protein n=1 Tax=Ancylomarina subtilis TaxID=1639035 RepID=A0A4Q7VHD9_9BACT|nr:hypothetical protein EV201_0077 [Ancylomarina subtilis]
MILNSDYIREYSSFICNFGDLRPFYLRLMNVKTGCESVLRA